MDKLNIIGVLKTKSLIDLVTNNEGLKIEDILD
jgi:hypothetical protein